MNHIGAPQPTQNRPAPSRAFPHFAQNLEALAVVAVAVVVVVVFAFELEPEPGLGSAFAYVFDVLGVCVSPFFGAENCLAGGVGVCAFSVLSVFDLDTIDKSVLAETGAEGTERTGETVDFSVGVVNPCALDARVCPFSVGLSVCLSFLSGLSFFCCF